MKFPIDHDLHCHTFVSGCSLDPEQNPAADAWKFGYRVNGIADVFKNKKAGVYAHLAS